VPAEQFWVSRAPRPRQVALRYHRAGSV